MTESSFQYTPVQRQGCGQKHELWHGIAWHYYGTEDTGGDPHVTYRGLGCIPNGSIGFTVVSFFSFMN